jgi:hypothetical protein
MPPLLSVTKEFKREALGVPAKSNSRQKVPDTLIVGPSQLKSDTLASVELKIPDQQAARPARHTQYVALRDVKRALSSRVIRSNPNNSIRAGVVPLQKFNANGLFEIELALV